MTIQVPEAVGSSGQFLESFVVSSSQHRQTVTIGSGASTAISPVTSSAGLLVAVSSGTITLSSAPTVIGVKSTTSNTPALTTVTTSGSELLAANANRLRLILQNAGTIPVLIALSTVNPVSTAYHVVLSASLGSGDGTGATYIDDMWNGPIRVAATASGGTISITEFSS